MRIIGFVVVFFILSASLVTLILICGALIFFFFLLKRLHIITNVLADIFERKIIVGVYCSLCVICREKHKSEHETITVWIDVHFLKMHFLYGLNFP